MIKATALGAAHRLTWGHVTVAHVIAGMVAGGTVFADGHLTSFDLTSAQTYVLGAIAVASFLTALGGRYAEIAKEIRSAAAAVGASKQSADGE